MGLRATAAIALLAVFFWVPARAASPEGLERLPPVQPAEAGTDAPAPAAPAKPPPASQVDPPVPVEEAQWQWYAPGSWCKVEVFGPSEGSVELGINGAAGTSDSFSLKTGTDLKWELPLADIAFDASYARTTADSKTTQDLAILNNRTDWKFRPSRWSLFHKTNLTFDKLRSFDMRLALNGGLGYKLIQNESTMLKASFGSGASREFGGVSDEWVAEGVFGIDGRHQLTDRQKVTVNFEYFPEWNDNAEYRFELKAAWRIVLDNNEKLHLKLEASDRYDSTPDGVSPNDINYAVLLLWKL